MDKADRTPTPISQALYTNVYTPPQTRHPWKKNTKIQLDTLTPRCILPPTSTILFPFTETSTYENRPVSLFTIDLSTPLSNQISKWRSHTPIQRFHTTNDDQLHQEAATLPKVILLRPTSQCSQSIYLLKGWLNQSGSPKRQMSAICASTWLNDRLAHMPPTSAEKVSGKNGAVSPQLQDMPKNYPISAFL